MMPKKKLPVVNTILQKYGIDQVKQLILDSDKKTTYLPKPIGLENHDTAVFDKFDSGNLRISIDGEKIPVIYMTNERWGEFEKTWQYLDDDKLMLPPFLTIKRSDKAEGTKHGYKYTVSNRKTFTYVDIPIVEDDYVIMQRYKVPQPAQIDLIYDVTFFSKYQADMNVFDEKITTKFSSRQEFTNINGHYFPLVVDSVDDVDELDDIDGNRFYSTTYSLRSQAYIIDKDEFEITKTAKFAKTEIGLI